MSDDAANWSEPLEPWDGKPAKAYVVRGATRAHEASTLSLPPRVPVILVPGILATKLVSKTRGNVWDPDDKEHMIWDHVCSKSEKQRARFGLRDIEVRRSNRSDDEIAFGFGEVVRDIYLPFFRRCGELCFRSLKPQFYVVGYRWTDSNRDASDRLIERWQEILDLEHAKADPVPILKGKCILITHSMGALIARAACKKSEALADSCLGVIQVVPPNQGAVVFYNRFHTGAINESWPVAKIMGNNAEKFSTTASAIRSAFELLPTNDYGRVCAGNDVTAYCSDRRREWLRLVSSDGEHHSPWKDEDVYDTYSDVDHPASICRHATKEIRSQLAEQARAACRFHEWLGSYMHPRTSIVTASGLLTDTGARASKIGEAADQSLRISEIRDAFGDGTVPMNSLQAQARQCVKIIEFCSAPQLISPQASHPGYVRLEGEAVRHADAMKNQKVIDMIVRLIEFHVLQHRKSITRR